MNFQYTIDPSAEKPIMLIDKHIGYDKEDGYGIMGDQFARELMALDVMGKKRIDVWINSPGGVVVEAMDIYNAILKSSAKVDTYGFGLVASCATAIFQAGRKRVMADYAVQMYHPTGGSEDNQALNVFKHSIVTMVSTRSKMQPDEVSAMMDKTTWLNAENCLELGLCDEVENSSENNKPRIKQTEDITAAWKEAKLITNKALSTTINIDMKKVTNKLGLQDQASEDAILSAIEVIENKAKEKDSLIAEKSKELEAKATEVTNLSKELEGLKAEKAEAEKKAKDAEASAAKAKAEDLVSNFIKLGKITEDTKDFYVTNAVTDYEGTKKAIEALPVNKKAPVINKGAEGAVPYNMASAMAKINNKSNK